MEITNSTQRSFRIVLSRLRSTWDYVLRVILKAGTYNIDKIKKCGKSLYRDVSTFSTFSKKGQNRSIYHRLYSTFGGILMMIKYRKLDKIKKCGNVSPYFQKLGKIKKCSTFSKMAKIGVSIIFSIPHCPTEKDLVIKRCFHIFKDFFSHKMAKIGVSIIVSIPHCHTDKVWAVKMVNIGVSIIINCIPHYLLTILFRSVV